MSARIYGITCFLDQYTEWVFGVFIFVTLLTPLVPFFQSIISHGKTRLSQHKPQGRNWLHLLNQCVVPKQYFTHFYATGILSLCLRIYLRNNEEEEEASHKFTLSWGDIVLLLHVSRRLYECCLVHQWTSTSHMHLSTYLVGITYYLFLPFVLRPCASNRHAPVKEEEGNHSFTSNNPTLIILFMFCVWAQYQQHVHHVILANLRQSSHKQQQAQEYKDKQKKEHYQLPQGAWFRYVSCPHYLAEILFYIGLCALQYSQDGWNHRAPLLLLWVVTVSVVNGLQSHAWYLENLPNYDRLQRRAVIPLVV